jgi:hypothetical protein
VEGAVEGRDLESFRAHWLPEVEAWSPKPSSQIARDGSFRITALPPGRGSILVRKEGDDRYAYLRDVHPSEGPFDLQLKKGKPIHGRIVGWPSNILTMTLVILSIPNGRDIRRTPDANGYFAFRGLPPGRYALRTSDFWLTPNDKPPVRRVIRLEDVEPSDEELVLDLGL